MSDEVVELKDVYAEVDKRDQALEVKILAEVDKRVKAAIDAATDGGKKKFQIVKRA
jgi:hypothetical protein